MNYFKDGPRGPDGRCIADPNPRMVQCQRPGCTKQFRFRTEGSKTNKYCSMECWTLVRKQTWLEAKARCKVCRKPCAHSTSLLCSNDCKNVYRTQRKTVRTECYVCHAPVVRRMSRVGRRVMCPGVCTRTYNATIIRQRMIYTPAFLRSLMLATASAFCAVPGCTEERRPNIYHACRKHKHSISASLRQRGDLRRRMTA